MNSYREILKSASETLRTAGIERPRHEAELILSSMSIRHSFLDGDFFSGNCSGLPKNREEIASHPEREISKEAAQVFQKFIQERSERKPLAYLLKEKEFYGRNFVVTPDVLIPRPETEVLIDLAKEFSKDFREKNPDKIPRILDVGTGSGAIAITLRQEIPQAEIFASDISNKALQVAQKNAFLLDNPSEKKSDFTKNSQKNNRDPINMFTKDYPLQIGGITFFQSDLLENIDEKFNLIVANLPYVDKKWKVSPETRFEPKKALFAKNGGMELIKKLLSSCEKNLLETGEVILELDTRQIPEIKKFAEKHNFFVKKSAPFALQLKKLV